MEINSPVPGSDFIDQLVETVLWSEDLLAYQLWAFHWLYFSTDVLLI